MTHKTDQNNFCYKEGAILFQIMSFEFCNSPTTLKILFRQYSVDCDWKDVFFLFRRYNCHWRNGGNHRDDIFQIKSYRSETKVVQVFVVFWDSWVPVSHYFKSRGCNRSKENETVKDLPITCNVTGVKSFPWLCTHYKSFIKYLAFCLNKIMPRVIWHPDEHAYKYSSFHFSRFLRDIHLWYRCKRWCFWVILSQRQDDNEKDIAYASGYLTKSERNWDGC